MASFHFAEIRKVYPQPNLHMVPLTEVVDGILENRKKKPEGLSNFFLSHLGKELDCLFHALETETGLTPKNVTLFLREKFKNSKRWDYVIFDDNSNRVYTLITEDEKSFAGGCLSAIMKIT